MEKTLRALQGLPVVCAGKRVGRVAQAALSDDLRRMDGHWVDAGLGGARFVPAEEIEVLGKPFGPNFMNAVQQIPAPDGQESGTVVTVFQKGYKLGDKIIRHATVVVAE